MSESLTKSGQLRKGFDYQDAYAIFLMTEWVEHPERVKWMKLEADEFGFLDDVVVMRADGSLRIAQVKFSVHPDTPADAWGWQHLLKKRRRSPSLIQKWFKSWDDATADFSCTVTGALVTNRQAKNEFVRGCRVLPDGSWKVDLKKFRRSFAALNRELLKQLSPASKHLVGQFFDSFLFEFEALSLDTFKENAKTRLEKLGVDEKGWQGLCDAVRKWTSEQNAPNRRREITLNDVKEALGWPKIKPLHQEFGVPQDFVLFDRKVHKALFEELKSPSGGIKVLFGSPGSGKSTYLSFLYGELSKAGWCCVRHHYFLRLADAERYPRLTHERACESIIHDLLEQAPTELLAKLTFQPVPDKLSGFIEQAAEYFAARQKSFVLIVDGLDEVTREKGAAELRRFLEKVLPPKTGLWLVLGTRPLAQSVLPGPIYELAPPERWIETRGFGRGGCERLLWFHRKELGLEKDHDRFESVVNKFFEKTAGHPLHSRYTIKTLLTRAASGPIWERDFDTIAPYDGDIAQYYDGLRRSLSSEAWEVAVLLVVAGFALSKAEILECLNPEGQRTPGLQNAMEQILCLTKETRDGIQIFHSSFRDYTRTTHDYKTLSSRVLTCLRDWLRNAATEALRWAHLSRVDYELGNSEGIFKAISREWTVRSIADCRPIDQILDQLRLGVHAAMESGEFGKAFEFGSHANYLENAPSFCDAAWEKMWAISWILNASGKPQLPEPDDVASFGTNSVVRIAREAARVDGLPVLRAALAELNRRAYRLVPVRKEEISDRWWPEAHALAVVAALSRVQVQAFLNWATSKSIRNAERTTDLLSVYVYEMCKSGAWSVVDFLIRAELEPAEKIAVVDAYSRVALLWSRRETGKWVRTNLRLAKGPWSHVLLALTNSFPKSRKLIFPPQTFFPSKTKDYMSEGERSFYRENFMRVYLLAVAAGLTNRSKEVREWIASTAAGNWSQVAACKLAEIGLLHGIMLSRSERPTMLEVESGLSGVMVLRWPKDRDQWELWMTFRRTLESLFGLVITLGAWVGKAGVSIAEIEALLKSAFFGRATVRNTLRDATVNALNSTDAEAYLGEEKAYWASEPEVFSERAEAYADLAEIAWHTMRPLECKEMIRCAADNLLGYGYHKDLNLHFCLETVEACAEAGSKRGPEWLGRLAPIIANVRRYTDGDETRHLPSAMAESYLKIQPSTLKSYYVRSARAEKFFLAQDIFPTLIASLDLSDPIARAVACTAVDTESFELLKSQRDSGNPGARAVLECLETTYHIVDGRKAESRQDYPKSAREDNAAEDFAAIQPKDLLQHISKKGLPYNQGQFLLEWGRVWLPNQPHADVVYRTILDWIDSVGPDRVDADIFDMLVPYAPGMESEAKTFEFICLAQKEGHGWSPYWTPKSKALKRWEIIRKDFPDRWKEFLLESSRGNEFGFPARRIGAPQVPIAVEFMIYFGQIEQAEVLCEAAVRVAEDLMANLRLPPVDWLEPAAAIDVWDVLFSRLTWPSPIVRERAASQISELLVNQETRETCLTRICGWLSDQRLESMVNVGLLAVAKAARYGSLADGGLLQRLRSSISAPSVVSNNILFDIEKHL